MGGDTFGVFNAGFQRREVGFHVSDLPERFLSWIPVYHVLSKKISKQVFLVHAWI